MKIQKYKHDSEYSYALGMTLVIEMLKSRSDVVTCVFVKQQTYRNESYKLLEQLCNDANVSIEQNDKAFNILSPKGNCFVIGKFRKFRTDLLDGSHIVLVNPSDAGNLGTIIRTAVGFKIPNIAIIRPAVDIFDPRTVRASMGALFHVNFSYYENFTDYLNCYSNHHMYPFMLKASKSIHEVDFQSPYSLLFGNEATGLPDYFTNLDNGTPVIIPNSNEVDSLNLTIAIGIGIYEATKDFWRK